VPVKEGAIDRIANIAARMKGWEDTDLHREELFPPSANGNGAAEWMRVRFRDGVKDYNVEATPLELFRSRTRYQAAVHPGGWPCCWLCMVPGARARRPVSDEMARFTGASRCSG